MKQEYLEYTKREYINIAKKISQIKYENIEKLLTSTPKDYRSKNSLSSRDIGNENTNKEEVVSKILEYIFNSEDVWLWKWLILSAIKLEMPFFALGATFQADQRYLPSEDQPAYFIKKHKEFYSATDITIEYKHDIYSIWKKNIQISPKFLEIYPFLSENFWPNLSTEFKDFLMNLKEIIPSSTLEKLSLKKEEESNDNIPLKKEVLVEKNEIESQFSQIDTLNGIPKDLSFLQLLWPKFLNHFLQLYSQSRWQEAENYLYEVEWQGNFQQPSFLNRFLLDMLRLNCLFNLTQEVQNFSKRIRPILESLWHQVLNLQQAEINFDKVEQITLAKIQANFYASLLELTLKYSEKCNKNQGFSVKQGMILSEESLRKQLAIIIGI